MVPIFIASNKGYSGKTFISLGLGLRLMEEGYKVGYMKPVGRTPVKKGRQVFDADAVAVREALSLSEPPGLVSPFIIDYETQRMIYEGKARDAKKRIIAAFKAVKKGKDFVIIEGPGDLFEGASLGIDSPGLITAFNARALLVGEWAGDDTTDSMLGGMKFITSMCGNGKFIGAVINKVPPAHSAYTAGTLAPFYEKKGMKVFGVFERDSLLSSVSVRELVGILGGKVLCSEDKLDEPVENFSIGAMDVHSALGYFRKTPNKAVITGAHRADIQLAALETSTKCIILTGGLYTNDVVLGKAASMGVPVVSVAGDTYSTIEAIEAAVGKTGISGRDKIERARQIAGACFDTKRFLRALGV